MIVVPRGKGHTVDVEALLAKPAWKVTSAAKNKRVICLDQDSASRAGPRLTDALERLAGELRK